MKLFSLFGTTCFPFKQALVSFPFFCLSLALHLTFLVNDNKFGKVVMERWAPGSNRRRRKEAFYNLPTEEFFSVCFLNFDLILKYLLSSPPLQCGIFFFKLKGTRLNVSDGFSEEFIAIFQRADAGSWSRPGQDISGLADANGAFRQCQCQGSDSTVGLL